MTYEPEDLELVVDHHQREAVESGHPPLHLAAWRKACKRSVLENEALMPGFVERAAAGLRAKAQGKRLTYCSETRGTHAISYVYDPRGTTEPPAWWTRDEAKREWAEHQKHGKPRPPAEVEALARNLRNIGIKESA